MKHWKCPSVSFALQHSEQPRKSAIIGMKFGLTPQGREEPVGGGGVVEEVVAAVEEVVPLLDDVHGRVIAGPGDV